MSQKKTEKKSCKCRKSPFTLLSATMTFKSQLLTAEVAFPAGSHASDWRWIDLLHLLFSHLPVLLTLHLGIASVLNPILGLLLPYIGWACLWDVFSNKMFLLCTHKYLEVQIWDRLNNEEQRNRRIVKTTCDTCFSINMTPTNLIIVIQSNLAILICIILSPIPIFVRHRPQMQSSQ